MLLNKPLYSLTERDLQVLVDEQKAERKTLEYKETLPGGSDGEKKEFLADVSSFANTIGGHILFGIEEQAGIPKKLVGVAVSDTDALKLQVESMLRTGISPRLPAIDVELIPLASRPGYWVLIIEVRQSWLLPHRVIFKDHGHFYSRNSAGKYRLDVPELRAAFELSGTAAERIKAFRTERLSRIGIGEETPTPLDELDSKLVLHLIPLSAFTSPLLVDLRPLLDDSSTGQLLKPVVVWDIESSVSMRLNVDGVMRSASWKTPPKTASYTQIYRNGIFEAVDMTLLGINAYNGSIRRVTVEGKRLHGEHYERRLVNAVERYCKLMEILGISTPIYVMLSFLGVKGYRIVHPTLERRFESYTDEIDRANLLLPEIVLDTTDGDVATLMRPIFDMVWNAVNERGSFNYDSSGNFTL